MTEMGLNPLTLNPNPSVPLMSVMASFLTTLLSTVRSITHKINHMRCHTLPSLPLPPPLTLLRPCDCGRYCSALCQSPLLIQQLVPAVDALCAHTLHSGSETNCTTLQRYYAMKLTLSSPMMSTI